MSTIPRTLRPTGFRWSLMLACNYHRNGSFLGHCDSVEIGAGRGNFTFGTDWLDEHCLTLTGPRIRLQVGKHSAKLGPLVFEQRGYKEWVGNWCWDACFVQRAAVREIAKLLKSRGWSVESAQGLLCEWFDRLG